jgi:hypothetical protein
MLELNKCTVTADSLENLFNQTQSLTKLKMQFTIIEGAFVAPSRTTSIEELELIASNMDEQQSSLIQVVDHVGPHSNIKRLSINGCAEIKMRVLLSRSIQQFFLASASVQSIKFAYFNFQALSFGPIATAIKSSHNLQDLNINRCLFDSESTELLKLAVKKNWSLKRVNFGESRLYYDDDHDDDDRDVDDNEDVLTAIQLYCDRNKAVPQLIANPDAVPASLWPNILESGLNYEHKFDALFRSVMAMVDGVGQQKSLKRSPP